jgi:hypothetical protein
MTAQEVKRKLAAILSADVKGYSRLIGGDEEWTVRILNENPELPLIMLRELNFKAQLF